MANCLSRNDSSSPNTSVAGRQRVDSGSVRGQGPSPTPGLAIATPTEVELTPSLQLIVSGPGQAAAGSAISYVVEYTALDPEHPHWTFRAFIEEPFGFVLAEVVSGSGECIFTAISDPQPPPNVTDVRGAVDCTVGSAEAMTGTVEITVRIDDGFEGEVTFGAFVPGTGLDTGDSINSITTAIVPAGEPSLPSTGATAGASHASSTAVILVLAAAGLAFAAVGAASLLLRRR